ncbi:hypothetical protein RFI_05695 [Reticulomyxa filosa]|uniref:Uncharacterized protein n=1 Tax=Reticulomyxa filosa TaxID=46433 RepID=X6P030_RETFI|nr:hypothetical protein RFI_05695 [Reticulomyxa filosa]|eukprot:ETO31429.1 hypothetical protein RFI_05695 [Reticulomyxa filosa]
MKSPQLDVSSQSCVIDPKHRMEQTRTAKENIPQKRNLTQMLNECISYNVMGTGNEDEYENENEGEDEDVDEDVDEDEYKNEKEKEKESETETENENENKNKNENENENERKNENVGNGDREGKAVTKKEKLMKIPALNNLPEVTFANFQINSVPMLILQYDKQRFNNVNHIQKIGQWSIQLILQHWQELLTVEASQPLSFRYVTPIHFF